MDEISRGHIKRLLLLFLGKVGLFVIVWHTFVLSYWFCSEYY